MSWVDIFLVIIGSAFAGIFCFVRILNWAYLRIASERWGAPEHFFVTLISVILFALSATPYALVVIHVFLGIV